ELAYLAHLYTRAYVAPGGGSDNSFSLYFKIGSTAQVSINVLPDFMPPGRVQITRVTVNGVEVTEDLDPADLAHYQIPTDTVRHDLVNGTIELVVEFQANPVQPSA
ncbi:MAG TPA: hypothetical protein VN306_17215, partial [Mycobacterium sp.]|nr:hypothetical protein [Mycobacterium sp.]